MIILHLLRWFSGYVLVEISEGFAERFINLCVCNGIEVWNTRRRGNITLYMPADKYKKLLSLRRRCKVKIKIIKKVGLPFYIKRFKRRPTFLIGFALYLAILFIMPNFIWNIEVIGNEKIPTSEITSALSSMNISVGTPISRIKGESDRNNLNLAVKGISWSSLNVVGTTLKVELREVLPTDTDKDTRFCNIIASRDGVVQKVYAEKGTAKVKMGAEVKKGDLLISGTEEYANGNTYFRHASGKVLAKTNRRIEVTLPITNQIKEKTGYTEQRSVLNFFGMKIPLFLGSVKYDYVKQTSEKTLKLNNVNLPISIQCSTFYKTQNKKVTYTDEQLLKMAKEKLPEKDFSEIVSRDIKTTKTDTHFILTADYTLIEDISQISYLKVDTNFSN